MDQKYADSSEIYTALCSYIRDAMTDNKDFAKIIYKYMVNSGAVTGQQLCLLLFDQGVLDYDDATVSNIAMVHQSICISYGQNKQHRDNTCTACP